jgi:glycosyltransferase involved in cell wall biosynthesis
MRVLFVVQRLPPDHVSGAPLQALTLARALIARGIEVEVLTIRHAAGQRLGRDDLDGVPIRRLPAPLGPLSTIGRGGVALLHGWLTRGRFDVIHGHALSATVLAAAAAASAPVLLKPSLSGATGDLARIGDSPLRAPIHHLLRRIDRFAAVDLGIESELAALGVVRSRVWTAKNGVDFSRFAPDPSAKASLEEEIGHRGPILLYAGQLIPRKGIEDLFAAFEIARGRCRKLVLLIAGEAQASGPGFLALGPRADMPRLLAAADCLILPSWREGLPNIALEALACGCPVVARRGLLPPSLAASAMVDEAVTVADMGEKIASRVEGGSRGRPPELDPYDITRVAAEYEQAYEALLAPRN